MKIPFYRVLNKEAVKRILYIVAIIVQLYDFLLSTEYALFFFLFYYDNSSFCLQNSYS